MLLTKVSYLKLKDIRKRFFFSLAPHKGSYLHLKVERYFNLLSKLDSYASLYLLSFSIFLLP